MRYLVAAVLLISSTLAYPIGENEGEQGGGGVPLVISDYASVAKSEESGEVHSQPEVQRDVSHEHGSPKVENDSQDSNEDSGSVESREKQQDEAKPNQEESSQKSSQEEKVEHQAQPSEIVNSEIAHDPVKEEASKSKDEQNPEPVPQSDPVVVPAQDVVQKSESAKDSNSVQSPSSVVVDHLSSVKNSDSVQLEPVGRSDDPQPQQDSKSSDEQPKVKSSDEQPKVPNADVPAPKILLDVHDVKPEIKHDIPVGQSDVVEEPKQPEAKEEPAEEKKVVADDAIPIVEPKVLPEESEKSKEDDKNKSILTDPVPVHDDVKDEVKVVQDPIPEGKEDVKPLHAIVFEVNKEEKTIEVHPIVAQDELVKASPPVVPEVVSDPVQSVDPVPVPNVVVPVAKSVQDVVSDELSAPAPKSDLLLSKDDSPKNPPEPEAISEKLSEHNSSS